MSLLHKALTKAVVQSYWNNPTIKTKIDTIISDLIPKEVSKLGLEKSISWALKNLKPQEMDSYINFEGIDPENP